MKHLRDHQIYFTGRVTADLEMNLQLMLNGNIGFIDDVVYRIRSHDENASNTFKDVQELDYSYIDLIKFIYGKALSIIENKAQLDRWYHRLMLRNMQMCLYLVLQKKDRKQLSSFHKLMLKKYRKEYGRLFLNHPKFIIILILNK